MKKFVIAAMMVLGATSAFAGDSDALKAIKKAKTYAEAETLVKQSLGSLASDAEKAAAYNCLVDLAMKDFSDQQSIQQMNQLTKKDDPVDTQVMYTGAYNALVSALECYKYDQMPNEKGKVKPKYNSNKDRVWGARIQLVNAGQDAAQKSQDADVLKYWGAFLDTEDAPIFADKEKEKETEKEYIGQVALWAAKYAYQAKDIARCGKYCDIAMKSEKEAKEALNLKLYVMKDGLKTKADSLAYVETLKAQLAKDDSNEAVIGALSDMYGSLKMENEQVALLDGVLAKDPNNYTALASKGLYYMQKNDAENAIKCLEGALQKDSKNVVVLYYLGLCYNSKAANMQDVKAAKNVFKQAVDALDKCMELDPGKAQINWGYVRYQAYYNYYGPDAAETKQAEAESK